MSEKMAAILSRPQFVIDTSARNKKSLIAYPANSGQQHRKHQASE